MHTTSISVTLSIGNGSWQSALPETLLRAGMLRRLLCFRPDLEVSEPDPQGYLQVVKRHNFNRARQIVWGLWTRVPGRKQSRLPVLAHAWLSDRLASRWAASGNIFHGWTATSLASLRIAKRSGAVTLLEYPMLHPHSWQREVLAECARFGINPKNCPAVLPEQLIQRLEREFVECDKIIVPSTTARRSFEEFPYAAKAVSVPPGVDHELFRPSTHSTSRPFRVCYVGRVELAKGMGYLLQAWKRLALPNAQLVLIGEYRAEVNSLFQKYATPNVRVTNSLAPQEVAAWYRDSNVFVFPSVNEGFGMVLLEAMASGLPVIASEGTGAHDCVTHGKDGFLVPARDVDALAETLLWCYQHPNDAESIGKNARVKVEAQFTLDHYNRRITDLYRSIVPELSRSDPLSNSLAHHSSAVQRRQSNTALAIASEENRL
jgi:glycosyltransferase involved in cell wall biosynthesis